MKLSKCYVCTERAHLMCPNMQFGIMAQIQSDYDEMKVRQSVEVLKKAHPFLQSLIAEEVDTGRRYYQVQDDLELSIAKKEDSDHWQRDYDEISEPGWDVRKESLLKILVYPKKNAVLILFIAHHLLCDGRGLLQLAEEFAQHYVKGVPPQAVEERLIRSIEDLPEHSDLPLISKLVVSDANRRWKKEKHQVSYEEYLEFEKQYISSIKINRTVTTTDCGEVEELHSLCRHHELSINDYLIAKLMMEEDTDKVVIAADIRHLVGCYRQGAMGNYATAYSIKVKKSGEDLIALAKKVASKAADIRKHPSKEMLVLACYLRMQPELIDAVAIAVLGEFESKAGAFVGKNMFGYGAPKNYSITNLGKLQSDVIAEAVFIPPSSPANRKTLGVLTVNGTMKVCMAVLTDDFS